jgi:hypothetical protein
MEQLKKLKTFESACKIEGVDPKKVLPDFSSYPSQHRKSMIAHAKLVIIVAAANRLANDGKTWKPDFDNVNQDKSEIWFYKRGSSGFRYLGCADWATYSSVGSRLCFVSSDVAEYVGKKFIKLYNEYLL